MSRTWIPADVDTGVRPVQITTPNRTVGYVWAQVLQNLAGGLGVAGLAALAAYYATGADWETVRQAAAVAGLVVFCGATAVRAFADEGGMLAGALRTEVQTRQRMQQFETQWREQLERAEVALLDAQAEIVQLRAVEDGLRRDRDMAKAELQQLRAKVEQTYRSKPSLYDGVRRDAKELLRITAEAQKWLARDTALGQLDWDRGKWEQAFQLLKDAGIVAQHGAKGNHVRLLVADVGAAYRMIDEYTGAFVTGED